MTKLIAETAWHHEGDFSFMENLVTRICSETMADLVKLHITLDLDEYMQSDHSAYATLKSWMLSAKQWESLINIIRSSGKELVLLVNDTKAIEFAAEFSPEYIEVHSICINVPRIYRKIGDRIDQRTKLVAGIGGCTLTEIQRFLDAVEGRESLLMFGFQNYPTRYEDVNLHKIRKIQNVFPKCDFGYADHTAWDEPNNELITLLVAANKMSYVEKHVTTAYGVERCDYSAAVSIDMFNSVGRNLKLLDQICGTGSLELNAGEKSYSAYGPMKMAGVATRDIAPGDVLCDEDLHFCRTAGRVRMSQADLLDKVGKTLENGIAKGKPFDWNYFHE